jgi:hypothetical protein
VNGSKRFARTNGRNALTTLVCATSDDLGRLMPRQAAGELAPTPALQEATAFGRYVRNTTPAITFDSMRGVPFHRPHAAPGLLVHLPDRGSGSRVRILPRPAASRGGHGQAPRVAFCKRCGKE